MAWTPPPLSAPLACLLACSLKLVALVHEQGVQSTNGWNADDEEDVDIVTLDPGLLQEEDGECLRHLPVHLLPDDPPEPHEPDPGTAFQMLGMHDGQMLLRHHSIAMRMHNP